MADLRQDTPLYNGGFTIPPAPSFGGFDPPEPGPTTQSVQTAVEGVPEDDGKLEFIGQWFKIAEDIGSMPMLTFAAASKKGLDTEDMDGMAAMHSMIRDCIHRPPLYDEHGNRVMDPVTGKAAYDESEWSRFEQHATDIKATGEELFAFVSDVMAIITARPPKQREVSSRYSPRTSPNSKGSSSSPGTRAPHGADGLTPVANLGH